MNHQSSPTHAPAHELPATGVFGHVSAPARQSLAAAGHFASLPHGAYLATQGEPHHTLSVLLSGTLNIFVHAHADTLHVASIHPGETVGEMNVLDPQERASADVVVAEPALVFSIEREAFQDLVQRDALIGLELVSALGKELCQRLRLASEARLRQTETTRANFRDMDY